MLAKSAEKCGNQEEFLPKMFLTDELCGKVRKDAKGLQKKVLGVREEKRSPLPLEDPYVELS